jgi:hypothetical protein
VLYVIGEWIADQIGGAWLPDIFEKDVHRSLHSLPSAAERAAEVAGKYRSNTVTGIDTLIILDDFITRGDTLGEMHRAFNEVNTSIDLVALALAKNESQSYAASQGVTVSNNHIPAEWDSLWTEAQNKAK